MNNTVASEGQKFDAVVRKVLAVSYEELQARERKYKQERAKKKRANKP